MKVRATKVGYYGMSLRRAGTVFNLAPVKGLDASGKPVTYSVEQQFSHRWMEKIGDDYAAKPSKNASKKFRHEEETQDLASDSEVI
jgi:hypothetical protein